ncbi:molybdopterin oxidoreductase family protein [Myceligenerans pegani]|uniref:Molybdopterin oxidoreductase family protein n=1 Tax=Myceligenerans pegani TaxID=2776917 RepID=A0ABR9MZZ8_9MICO|nr:molybdopterin oxidoreductase family protein [Myceligenerans sp. TRM 65318]MBE1876962.1 molybdopterin oxidoreductase family protein [Myceligenerans sp. TRM 65318]MBE3019233.1 molybdopterin oxidoreductase family protein [Myceligenerans sp. TRM 65318]
MTDTHCPYCALQCGMSLAPGTEPGAGGASGTPSSVPDGGRGAAGSAPDVGPRRALPLTVTPREFPTNRGGLCQKGWTSSSVLTATDRITTPLVRHSLLTSAGQDAGAADLRDDPLVPASWDTVLDLVAGKLAALRAEHGPESVAVFGGGGLTNEKAYALGKFARTVLQTPNIDYNGRFCMSSAAAATNRALGADRGLPFPLADLGGADVVLLLGSNLAETMPPAVQHLAGAREAGRRGTGGLVVVDPRVSATAKLTDDGAGVHLQPVPGTDMVVLLGLLHVVLAEGLADREYLAERVTGFEDVARSVAVWWPERAETVCGVPAEELRRVARLLAVAAPAHGGRGAYVLTGRGVEQSAQGTATVTAAINLALTLGLVGREGSGYGAVTGQGNGQGGREHGQKSDQLPGYRKIDDPVAREYVANVWGVTPESLPGPGKPAVQLLQSLGARPAAAPGAPARGGSPAAADVPSSAAASSAAPSAGVSSSAAPAVAPPGGAGARTRPRALLVHGSNLIVSAPNADSVTERLKSLELLVVSDFVPSETALLADVVLPVTQWAEEEGTMTSLEGRVIRRRRAAGPPGEARSELWILAELARRLGTPGETAPGAVRFPTDPAEVFDELARASRGGVADYSGLSHARLDADEAASGPGFFWPVPATPTSAGPSASAEPADRGTPDTGPAAAPAPADAQIHPGTPRMFLDGFPTPDGRARMIAVDHNGPADDVRPGAPLYLVTGRVLQHYQSGAQTHRVAELERLVPEPYIEIHPVLGFRIGVPDGARARLTTDRGFVEATARWTDAVRPDTVFMPFHWSGVGSVNRVTTDATDPISGMPEFKVCAVEIAPVPDGVPPGSEPGTVPGATSRFPIRPESAPTLEETPA